MNRASFIVLNHPLTWQNVWGSRNLDHFIWAGRLNSTFSGITPRITRIYCAWTRRLNFLCPSGFMWIEKDWGCGIEDRSDRSGFYFANSKKSWFDRCYGQKHKNTPLGVHYDESILEEVWSAMQSKACGKSWRHWTLGFYFGLPHGPSRAKLDFVKKGTLIH